MLFRKIIWSKRAIAQRAVWRNGGSTPAETAVRIWKFVPRRKCSGSRHYAKPLGRCMQFGDSAALKQKKTEMKIRFVKIMRQLITIFVLLFFKTTFAQEIELGKYRLCYDMYWRCHFQNILELKSDSTYEFVYLDDTQMEKTTGTWHIEPNFLVLTPFVIPDTLTIRSVQEIYNEFNKKQNEIEIYECCFTGIDTKVTLYRKEKIISLKTNSDGKVFYDGAVADSISFLLKGREFQIVPERKKFPSKMMIYVDFNYRDLVYRQLGTNKIMIRDGRMFIRYRDTDLDGKESELKTEYFERIQ